jgi:ADP-ribose pyrophosphatase YjhB (NUDIX family)
MSTQWLDWARELAALAQTGLKYNDNPFELERLKRIQAIAAEIISEHSEAEFERVNALLAGEIGDATPKVDVRGVIFDGDKVLLVSERMDGGRWTLPGGWADVNESPSQSAIREVWEESGYEVRATRILAVYDRAKHNQPPHIYSIYKLFFLCEIIGGAPQSTFETDGVDYFPIDDLPELSIGRTTQAQIKRLYELYRDPSLPTDFD